jgi:DNA helicase-2/ATP-dependent DNA helicase PcrA
LHYQIVGSLRFYDRKEVKDAISYLRLALNPADDTSFLRAIAAPGRGIGDKSLEKLAAVARAHGTSLLAAAQEHPEEVGLQPRQKNALEQFAALGRELATAAESQRPSQYVRRVLDQSGLLESLRKEADVQSRSRLENLEELVNVAAAYEEALPDATVADFLDRVSLLGDADYGEQPSKILLMTLHTAKGLEFEVVFLVGLEEGIFPHQLSLDQGDELEEERRLCYVGMTRARKHLVLSWALRRRVYGSYRDMRPSRFLEELPPDLVRPIQLPARYLSAYPSKAAATRSSGGRRYEPVEDFSQYYEEDELAGPKRGERVFHPKFGEGVVLTREGEGDSAKLTVRFATVGPKKIVARFVTPR